MKILSLLMALVLAMTVVACGGDEDDPVDIADATNCDQVMEAFFPLMQDLLDAVSELEMADLMSEDTPDELVEFEERMEEFGTKAEELNCTDEEMSAGLAEGIDDLTAEGPVAEFLLEALRSEGIE